MRCIWVNVGRAAWSGPSKKNAPFRGKFYVRLIMREIGSVADDLDVGAILEGVFIHIAPLRDTHFGEAGAIRESTLQNIRYRWRDGDAREAGATGESIAPNLRHRWWDGDAFEAGATFESTAPNIRYRWRDGDAREAGATIESIVPNLRPRFWQSDFREVLATIESKGLNPLYPLR